MENDVAIQQQNEQNLARLMVSLETSAPRLSLLLAICEDDVLRDELIGRYERELPKGIGAYRVKLAREEPSLRMALANLVQKESALQEKPIAVVSVLGAEVLRTWLPVIDSSSNDGRVAQQTEREKFFGYLQWTREGLREFPFAIVLWLTQELYRDIARKAPDFWSWRDGVFEFKSLRRSLIDGAVARGMGVETGEDGEDFFYSIPELEERIAQVVAKFGAMDRSLITLYGQLARMYTARLSKGVSANLGFEKDLAIDYFQKTIELQEHYELQRELAETLLDFGRCFYYQDEKRKALIQYNRALNIYREIGDQLGEANTLRSIGDVFQFLSRSTEALEKYESALGLYREISDQLGEANTLRSIGDVLQFLSRSTEAIEKYESALGLYREISDRLGEANTLKALGDVLQFLSRSTEAIEKYESALGLYREISDRLGEANTLKALGDILQFLNHSTEALEKYETALAFYREIGARLGEANTLQAIGDVLQFLDRRKEALEKYEVAIALYREINSRAGEANTLQAIGDILQFLKRSTEALERYETALAFYREIGSRAGEANTLKAIGDVLQFLKRSTEALERYETALAFYREIGSRAGEANTLQAIGDVLQFLKRSTEALERYETALAFYREIGSRAGEANTLQAIGDILQFLKRSTEALERYEAALAFYREIGSRLGEANVLLELAKSQANPRKGLESLQIAQEIYKQIGDQYSQSRNLLFFISELQIKCGEIDAAILSLQQAEVIATEIDYEPFITSSRQRITQLTSGFMGGLMSFIHFAQRGWWQLGVCLVFGLVALPILLIAAAIILIWRLFQSLIRQ